jgi:hypothetical protein
MNDTIEDDQTDGRQNLETDKAKNYLFLREIICKYHPEFVNNEAIRTFAMKNPEAFNIPLMVEKTLAVVGSYNHEATTGRDFNDGSDAKTLTIKPRRSGYRNTYGAA